MRSLTPFRLLLTAGGSLLLAGCATSKKPPQNYSVYPQPPDEPRIQFLASFSDESQLGGQSDFAKFVVGRDQAYRPIWKPYGITTTKGAAYICDTQPGNVTTVDFVKHRFRYLRPTGLAAMKMPIGVATDRAGNRYVTDTTRAQVLIYSPSGDLLDQIGAADEMKPCGIAIHGERLHVTDLKNHCVRVYDLKSRRLLLTAPRDASREEAQLFSPTNVAIDREGRMYVSDTGGFTVKVYDADGNFLRAIGERGLDAGRFALPKGVAVDREGRAFVVDAATGLAQVFDADGKLLMFFGDPKAGGTGAMYLPAGIAVDYENISYFEKFVMPGRRLDYLIFVTNQAGSQKVNVYGFLRAK
jgi:sugar lactone lactonase YvrE